MLLDFFYILALILASPWLIFRLITTGRYRTGNAERFLGRVTRLPEYDGGPTLWLHAVSVGEVNLLPLLVKRLEAACPQVRCVISTTTLTGMEIAQKRFGQSHPVFYFPLDFSWSVREALRRIRPQALVLAELEVWPHLVSQAARQGIPVIVFNGRISDASFGAYKTFKWALKSAFRKISLVIAQTPQYSERFECLGVPAERIETVGSIKFEGAQTDRNSESVRKVRRLTGKNGKGGVWRPLEEQAFVFLAGSTQDPEEEMALESFLAVADSSPNVRLILVPRHPERFDAVADLLTKRGVDFIRRTQLTDPDVAGSDVALSEVEVAAPFPIRVLLVDAMGELGAWWGVADLAFVGGSMGSRGGQNMIEPAAYGAAVSFGPNTRNFRDVVSLMLGANAAVVVQDGDQMAQFVRKGIEDLEWRTAIGNRAKELVLSQRGAANKTVQLILEQVNRSVGKQ